ncbi:Peptidase dimerisation domain containing protein, putative [Leishmania lindenbergi]|uniref:Peptidase dimerization domain containing protein n=2 Tax=Viannia TaxID=37616 RepID=A0AAW3AJZ6_9TRYP
MCVDPIHIASEVVANLQSVVSRRVSALKAPVLSVTHIAGGTGAYNVIPDSVHMRGTLRCLDRDTQACVPGLMEEMIAGITKAHGAQYELSWLEPNIVTYNDPKAYEVVKSVAEEMVSKDAFVVKAEPMFGVEDFSEYVAVIPGCFSLVGIRDEVFGSVYTEHSAKFKIAEPALKNGVMMHVGTIMKLMVE